MTERIRIAVVNGPNINLLGIREVNHYGSESWSQIEQKLCVLGEELGVELIFFQSNHEGCIIDFIQEKMNAIDGIVLNPAGYSSTGFGMLDALTALPVPFVEVHLSNVFAREHWHSQSVFTAKAVGTVFGFRGFGYELGLRAIVNHIISNRG